MFQAIILSLISIILLLILAIKKRWHFIVFTIAFLLFLTPLFSLYEAGKSTYWTFSGDGYWTRAILLLILDLPSLGILIFIMLWYPVRVVTKERKNKQVIMGYIFASLVTLRLFFHFVLSDAWVYFYMRNYFAPSIYQNISPHAINDSYKNITTQLKLLFPNKVEQKLVLAYAQETQNILNAYVIQDGAIATEKRWFIWDCMRDAIKRESRLKYDPYIWNTIHNIEYTIVNTYKNKNNLIIIMFTILISIKN